MNSRELFIMAYGIKPVAPANHFYRLARPPKELYTQFMFFCIKDSEYGPILIDQGCTNQTLEARNLPDRLEHHPIELLNTIQVNAEDVKHIILSHLHWDHFAGDITFPNAIYYIHEKEIAFVTGPLMRFKTYANSYFHGTLEAIQQLQKEGRIRLIKGDAESPFRGIECLRTGGHTPGHMSVAVTTGRAVTLFCGDVAPRYQNLEETIACGIHTDVTEALVALETIWQRAGDLAHAVPGHDPQVTQRYRQIAPGVHRIA